MKKVLFLSLVLAMGTTAFAQKTIVKKTDAAKQSVTTRVLNYKEAEAPVMNFQHEVMPKAATRNTAKGFEEWTTMTTNYDLQSNSALANRVATWDDGTAAVVATWDYSGSTSYPDRGAGYNYYDGESFGDEPTTRVEPVRSGWPSIAPQGDGEILASHASATNIYKRATKGEGEWIQSATVDYTWPRIATTGNGQYVHVVNGDQNSSNTLLNYVYYYRSTDGGETFSEAAYPPLVDVDGEYNNLIGADDYVMATNGNTIAILFGSINYDIFYIISRDNGETWEKQVVAKHPYPSFDWSLYDQGLTADRDTIWWEDNSHSIAIDDNGTVHVAFALGRWVPASNSGEYSYWPYTIGIVYWNSEYVNENGGHDIPMYGSWSGDAAHAAEWGLNGPNGISSTLNDARIEALAEADGYQHLNIFGWPDENGDGVYDVSENWGNRPDGTYRTIGMATMPAVSVDNEGNVAVLYNVLSETRVETVSGFYFRSAYVTYKDATGAWYADSEGDNLSADFVHQFEEVYSTTAAPNGKDREFWVCYSGDESLGLVLDENQSDLTDNIIYMVKLAPECLGVNDNQAVNPMTNVRVYPNPVQDVLNIEVNASQSSEMNIAVYNITGQKVMETSANISAGINNPSINVSNLNSGIYFVTVKANGFENTMKFVVK